MQPLHINVKFNACTINIKFCPGPNRFVKCKIPNNTMIEKPKPNPAVDCKLIVTVSCKSYSDVNGNNKPTLIFSQLSLMINMPCSEYTIQNPLHTNTPINVNIIKNI